MNKPTFILALDAGHYLATPGKRCLKSLDPKETREWLLNDRVIRYQQERARMYEGLIAVRVDDPTGRTETTLAERVAYCSKGSTKSPVWQDALYDAVIAAGGLRGDRREPKARADWSVDFPGKIRYNPNKRT